MRPAPKFVRNGRADPNKAGNCLLLCWSLLTSSESSKAGWCWWEMGSISPKSSTTGPLTASRSSVNWSKGDLVTISCSITLGAKLTHFPQSQCFLVFPHHSEWLQHGESGGHSAGLPLGALNFCPQRLSDRKALAEVFVFKGRDEVKLNSPNVNKTISFVIRWLGTKVSIILEKICSGGELTDRSL